MHEYKSGAKRSIRMNRYDLIPKCAIERLAKRFTGEMKDGSPTGGALKYGEGNWERGLPTSDVINHIIDHLLNYQELFRLALSEAINAQELSNPKDIMEFVQDYLKNHTEIDDELAGAMWGIVVLMYQEDTGMFHDDLFQTAERKQRNASSKS